MRRCFVFSCFMMLCGFLVVPCRKFDSRREKLMSKKAAEHHHKAAEHHVKAA
jgi:hypothetical protein